MNNTYWTFAAASGSVTQDRIRTHEYPADPQRRLRECLHSSAEDAAAQQEHNAREAGLTDAGVARVKAGTYMEVRVTGQDRDGVLLVTPTGRFWEPGTGDV